MNITNVVRSATFAAIVAALWSCYEDTIHQTKEDYFPIENNLEWAYQRWLTSAGDDASSWILDTLRLRVNGDTLVGGKLYKKITNTYGATDKIVRVEASRYYGRNHEVYSGYSDEYMFLDTDKPEGSAWEYFKNEGTKTEYVIRAKGRTHNISGIVYEHVIEVEVNYYSQESPGVYRYRFTSLHYYAKGTGEIFNHYPYPVSGYYANSRAFLIAVDNGI